MQVNHAFDTITLLTCKAFLVVSNWNSCNSSKAEALIGSCERDLKNLGNPLDSKLIEVYLLMAEYYLIAEYPYELSDQCIDRAGIIQKNESNMNNDITGRIYFLKGHSAYLKKDYENALLYLNRSAELLKNRPSVVRYECMNYIYITYLTFAIENDNKKALNAVESLSRRSDLPQETRAILYYLAGIACYNQKDQGQAKNYFDRAQALASSTNTAINNSVLFRIYFELANLNENNDVLRIIYLEKALEKAELISSVDKDVLSVYLDLADFYYKQKDYKRTLKITQNALIRGSVSFSDTSVLSNPSVKELRQYDILIDILTRKAYALVRVNLNDMKYTDAGLKCTELAAELCNRRLHYVESENSGLLLAENRRRIYNNAVTYAVHLYTYKGGTPYAEKAFYLAEKSKIQVLRMNSGKPEIQQKAGIPDSLIRKFESLENEILEIENSIALYSSKGDEIPRRLSERLTYLIDERGFLNNLLLHKYPAYQDIRFDQWIPSIGEIQSALEKDQALLEYQLTEREIIIFIITKDGFFLHHQLVDKVVSEQIENVRRHVSQNPALGYNEVSFESFAESSSKLYEILIRPVYEKIEGRRLIIIPHSIISLVPFEALMSSRYSGKPDYRKPEWLIKEFPVIYSFSAGLLFDRTFHKRGKGMSVFVPWYGRGDSLKQLQGAASEAEFLKRFAGARVFCETRASECSFKNESASSKIVHIASHTYINDRTPDLSCFLMDIHDNCNDDGRLYAFEIKQLKLNAKLVVLSGCNTGYGKLRSGEGFISLARSFYYAGIRTVAFTLWSVADKSSTDVMKEFYRELSKGRTMDQAMKNSKIRFLLEADPVKAHPYYWAGFVVTGRAQPVMINRIYVYSAVLMILLVFMLPVFSKKLRRALKGFLTHRRNNSLHRH